MKTTCYTIIYSFCHISSLDLENKKNILYSHKFGRTKLPSSRKWRIGSLFQHCSAPRHVRGTRQIKPGLRSFGRGAGGRRSSHISRWCRNCAPFPAASVRHCLSPLKWCRRRRQLTFVERRRCGGCSGGGGGGGGGTQSTDTRGRHDGGAAITPVTSDEPCRAGAEPGSELRRPASQLTAGFILMES